jgi:hypothetical protein
MEINSRAIFLRNEIGILKEDLKKLENELNEIYSSCDHKYGETVHELIREKDYSMVSFSLFSVETCLWCVR